MLNNKIENKGKNNKNINNDSLEIYKLGEHYLLHADSTDASVVDDFLQKVLGEQKISLILTDPPYGVNYVKSKESLGLKVAKTKTIENDGYQSDEKYTDLTIGWCDPLKKYLSEYNTYYIFNGDSKLFALYKALKELNFYNSQLLIWIKNSCILGRKDYLPQHELIAYGWYGKHKFKKSKDKSVLFYPKPNKSKLHPTMKPVGLLRRLILNSTNINDFVIDSFGGSGSTLIACEQTKRKCLMIEKDKEYILTIISRYEKITGIKAIKL